MALHDESTDGSTSEGEELKEEGCFCLRGFCKRRARVVKGDEEAQDHCGGGDDMSSRQCVGLFLALSTIVGFLITESSSSLTRRQHRTLGVLIFAAIMWISEAIPIPLTGMIVGPLLFLLDVCRLGHSLSAYFSNVTLVLFGSSFISIAMERHGLDVRFAKAITNCSWVESKPTRMRMAMMLAGFVMSMWVTNTGSAYILTPIVLRSFSAERQRRLEDHEEQRTLMGSLLSVAYACNTGGMGTLVGTGSNLVVVRFLREMGVQIDFVRWMVVGVPAALSVVSVCYLVLYIRFKPVKSMTTQILSTGRPEPWTFGEKVVAASFVFTASLWVFPAFYALAHGSHYEMVKRKLLAGVSVLIGTFPMFIIPDRGDSPRPAPFGPPVGGGHRVLPWSVAKSADWGIVMLVGGGLAIGSQMQDTGLADVMAEQFVSFTGINDIWVLTFVTTMLTVFATEITSNTATTSIMVPVVIAVSKSVSADPNAAVAPAMGVALGASCAFMLPIATPPNYIVKETGHVDFCQMASTGFIINVICSGLIWLILRVIVPLVWGV